MPAPLNLSGIWHGVGPSGLTIFFVIHDVATNDLWWVGLDDTEGGLQKGLEQTHVFAGSLYSPLFAPGDWTELTGNWADVPRGRNTHSGPILAVAKVSSASFQRLPGAEPTLLEIDLVGSHPGFPCQSIKSFEASSKPALATVDIAAVMSVTKKSTRSTWTDWCGVDQSGPNEFLGPNANLMPLVKTAVAAYCRVPLSGGLDDCRGLDPQPTMFFMSYPEALMVDLDSSILAQIPSDERGHGQWGSPGWSGRPSGLLPSYVDDFMNSPNANLHDADDGDFCFAAELEPEVGFPMLTSDLLPHKEAMSEMYRYTCANDASRGLAFGAIDIQEKIACRSGNQKVNTLHCEISMFARPDERFPGNPRLPALPGWGEGDGSAVLINGKPLRGDISLSSPQVQGGNVRSMLFAILAGRQIISGSRIRIVGVLSEDCGHASGASFTRDCGTEDSNPDIEIHPVFSIDLIEPPAASNGISGVWGDNDGATYYFTEMFASDAPGQPPERLVLGYGTSPYPHTAFHGIFVGKVLPIPDSSSSLIEGEWNDLPGRNRQWGGQLMMVFDPSSAPLISMDIAVISSPSSGNAFITRVSGRLVKLYNQRIDAIPSLRLPPPSLKTGIQ